jgi:hypothetical protein
MRKGRLFLTGLVGTVLLGALVLLVGLDLAHHRPTTPVSGYPNTWHPVQPAPAPVDPQPKPPEPAPGNLNPQRVSLEVLLNGVDAMELQALDRNLTIKLEPGQVKRLKEALATAIPTDDGPSPSAWIARYPSLHLLLDGPRGSAELRLNNLERLATLKPLVINDHQYSAWTMPPGFWAEVASWLPPETSKPGELAYLLRAEQLIEPYPSGPLIYDAGRAALMARLLQAGAPTAQTADDVRFTHTYVVEGRQYPIQVGVDWFTYAGKSYQLKDAALVLGATLHAN